jgi:(p)ppGpp synthase/HD superfamily hydrolase
MADGGDRLAGRVGPIPPEPWLYSRRFIEAAEAALTMHAAQRRKGTHIPYASHLLGACSIALDYGADEPEAIAALLHDAIEDVPDTAGARAAVAGFGPEVLRIVEACTDADTHPKPDWKPRKIAYLKHLGAADGSVLLVSAADKLHNARSIVADLRGGVAVWGRFNATKAEVLGYYRALVAAYRANPAHRPDLIGELQRTVSEMGRLAGLTEADAPPLWTPPAPTT